MSRLLRHSAVPLFLFLCLLLGGSPQGIWRNFVLQMGGILLIGWALLASRRSHPTPAARLLLWLGTLWIGLVLLQLLPLPPALWSALPGRAPVVEGFALRGEPLPWLPLSLSPTATADMLPVIAVPLGILAAMLLLGAYRSRWCVAALAVGTSISVLLGALQLAQGGPYLFPHANVGVATGLFANGNHQATLLLATIPFLAALIGKQFEGRRSSRSAALGRTVIGAGALAVVLLGVALNGSLAALALLAPVTLASIALVLPRAARTVRLLAGASLGLLLLAALGLSLAPAIGGADASAATRADMWRITVDALGDSFPAGIGLGAFAEYYRLYEDPALVSSVYINHAHSDPLEWLLETGILGALLLGALLFWWGTQAVRLWRAERGDPVALAATIASAAILAHSLVDYPLRDAAIQAVFALCLAFMAEPRSHEGDGRAGRRGRDRAPRHLSIDDVAVSA